VPFLDGAWGRLEVHQRGGCGLSLVGGKDRNRASLVQDAAQSCLNLRI
jgi:hypothetical protein